MLWLKLSSRRPAILEDIELTRGSFGDLVELNDDLGNGSFQVTLTKIAGNGVLIQSTGNAGKQTSIVSLKLDLKLGDGFDFDMIFAGGEGTDSALLFVWTMVLLMVTSEQMLQKRGC